MSSTSAQARRRDGRGEGGTEHRANEIAEAELAEGPKEALNLVGPPSSDGKHGHQNPDKII